MKLNISNLCQTVIFQTKSTETLKNRSSKYYFNKTVLCTANSCDAKIVWNWRLDTLKIKKICFSPKVPIQPCGLKSDSAPPGAIWAQFRLKQLNEKAIPAHGGPTSARVIGLYWPWFKGAKLDSKIGPYDFTHGNGPTFRAKTDFFYFKCRK